MTSPRLTPERHRALKLLVSNRYGISAELLVRDHGVHRKVVAGLVRSGLAVAEHEMTKGDDQAIEVVWIRITTAGRKALAASTY